MISKEVEPEDGITFREIDNQGITLSKIEEHESRATPISSRGAGEAVGRKLTFGAPSKEDLATTSWGRDKKTEYSLRPKPVKTTFFGRLKPVMSSTPGKKRNSDS